MKASAARYTIRRFWGLGLLLLLAVAGCELIGRLGHGTGGCRLSHEGPASAVDSTGVGVVVWMRFAEGSPPKFGDPRPCTGTLYMRLYVPGEGWTDAEEVWQGSSGESHKAHPLVVPIEGELGVTLVWNSSAGIQWGHLDLTDRTPARVGGAPGLFNTWYQGSRVVPGGILPELEGWGEYSLSGSYHMHLRAGKGLECPFILPSREGERSVPIAVHDRVGRVRAIQGYKEFSIVAPTALSPAYERNPATTYPTCIPPEASKGGGYSYQAAWDASECVSCDVPGELRWFVAGERYSAGIALAWVAKRVVEDRTMTTMSLAFSGASGEWSVAHVPSEIPLSPQGHTYPVVTGEGRATVYWADQDWDIWQADFAAGGWGEPIPIAVPEPAGMGAGRIDPSVREGELKFFWYPRGKRDPQMVLCGTEGEWVRLPARPARASWNVSCGGGSLLLIDREVGGGIGASYWSRALGWTKPVKIVGALFPSL